MLLALRIIGFVVTVILLCCGCNTSLLDSHVSEMNTIYAIAGKTVDKLGSGNSGQFAVGAQAINPGIEVEAGVKYFATARYVGLAGQLTAGGHGTFNTELTESERSEYQAIQGAQYRTNAAKQRAIDDLLSRIGRRVISQERAALNDSGGDQGPLPEGPPSNVPPPPPAAVVPFAPTPLNVSKGPNANTLDRIQ